MNERTGELPPHPFAQNNNDRYLRESENFEERKRELNVMHQRFEIMSEERRYLDKNYKYKDIITRLYNGNNAHLLYNPPGE